MTSTPPQCVPTPPLADAPHFATFQPDPKVPLPAPLVKAVKAVEQHFGKRAMLLLQHDGPQFDEFTAISPQLIELLVRFRRRIPKAPVLLIIESSGGMADPAFWVARFLRRHCTQFSAIVPNRAKSAATLICLGAADIYLGEQGELGPLDAQVGDHENFTDRRSALEDVQALQELVRNSLRAMDASMDLMLSRQPHGMGVRSLLPIACDFASNLMRPLFQGIDAVRLGKMFRALEIGRNYAIRLLTAAGYNPQQADIIASTLVTAYPDHGFAIDDDEARRMGLKVQPVPAEVADAMEVLRLFCGKVSALGFVEARPAPATVPSEPTCTTPPAVQPPPQEPTPPNVGTS